MPEAVIVATARSPDRAGLQGLAAERAPRRPRRADRPAALTKVPALDPHDIDDLMLGCGLPGGEQGYNMARVVAVLLGYDHLPGTTITRYCSSSLQTTRMALHAIKAGEGDVFISRGRRDGVPVRQGHRPTGCPTPGTRCSTRRRSAPPRSPRTAPSAGATRGTDPRDGTAALPDVYIAMGQTAENLALLKGVSREEMDEFGVRSQNLAEQAIADGFWAREITPVHHARRQSSPPTTARGRASRSRASRGLKPVFRPDGRITAGNCCALNDGAAAVVDHERHQGRASSASRHWPGSSSTGVTGLSPGDHGPRPGRGVRAGARRAPA